MGEKFESGDEIEVTIRGIVGVKQRSGKWTLKDSFTGRTGIYDLEGRDAKVITPSFDPKHGQVYKDRLGHHWSVVKTHDGEIRVSRGLGLVRPQEARVLVTGPFELVFDPVADDTGC